MPRSWKNAPFSDWNVIVDTRKYPIHRIIVNYGSQYFSGQFNSFPDSGLTNLSSLSPKCKGVWEKVLDFLYSFCDSCKSVPIPVEIDEVVPLYSLSDYLGIDVLKNHTEKRFFNFLSSPENSLTLYFDSIEEAQEKLKNEAKLVVSKHFSLFDPKDYLSLNCQNLIDLLSTVADYTNRINQTDKKQLFFNLLVQSIAIYLEEIAIAKEEFEELIKFGLNGNEKKNNAKLLKFAHHFENQKCENILFEKIANKIEETDIGLFSSFEFDILKILLEKIDPIQNSKFIYAVIVDYFEKSKDLIDETIFDHLMKKIKKIQKENIDLIRNLSIKFNYSHYDKCSISIANDFSKIPKETILSFSLNEIIGILSNDYLQVESEDIVFDTIKEYLIKNETKMNFSKEQKSNLWKCCRFAFLSIKYLLIDSQNEKSIPKSFIIEGLSFSKYFSELNICQLKNNSFEHLNELINHYKKRAIDSPITSTQQRKVLGKEEVDFSLSKVSISSYALINSPFKFNVEIFDSNKQYMKSKISISVLSPKKEKILPKIQKTDVGRFCVEFTPTTIGNFTVKVEKNNQPIGKSPFTVSAQDFTVCSDKAQILNCIKNKQLFVAQNMNDLDLRGQSLRDEEARLIGIALANSPLHKLDLENNQISDEGAKSIGTALKTNFTLQHLDLRSNQISNEGAKEIANGLKDNPTLQKLYLNDNLIGDEGAESIGNALETNSALQILYLYNNQIRDGGVEALAIALLNNSTLLQLSLYKNKIGDAGAIAIGNVLRGNSTLQMLWLQNNQISDVGAKAIGDVLQTNFTLQKLNLQDNNITESSKQLITTNWKKRTNYLRL
eukprot:TRINITY_DN5506_c0_g1_i3.p1 TRINITY_DN5506_c0_g1~~TRINITY_DN5506_c0_g1_i3.p1  ORF type:complete len:835 (+),score=238.95 TRINITY_DN5506_c0_g1_i3:54-2558(+)